MRNILNLYIACLTIKIDFFHGEQVQMKYEAHAFERFILQKSTKSIE